MSVRKINMHALLLLIQEFKYKKGKNHVFLQGTVYSYSLGFCVDPKVFVIVIRSSFNIFNSFKVFHPRFR